MKVESIWFDGDYIYGKTDSGDVLRQPLRFYPRLRRANDEQRADYYMSTVGIHWRSIDEDISFESFECLSVKPCLVSARNVINRRDVCSFHHEGLGDRI